LWEKADGRARSTLDDGFAKYFLQNLFCKIFFAKYFLQNLSQVSSLVFAGMGWLQ